jgi:hypothetical protein
MSGNTSYKVFYYRGYRVETMVDGLMVASPMFGSVSDKNMMELVYKINAELRRTEATNGTITGIKFDSLPEGKS